MIEMEIKGRIRAAELDEEILFRSVFDPESGNVTISQKTER